MTVFLRLLGKIPCHTDHFYDFGGNIDGRQAIITGAVWVWQTLQCNLIIRSILYNRGTTQETRPSDDLYNRALEITGCESIETTLRTRRPLWAGTLLRMSGGRLPKRIVFGNLEGAVRKGRGGKEKIKSGPIASRATSGRLA